MCQHCFCAKKDQKILNEVVKPLEKDTGENSSTQVVVH